MPASSFAVTDLVKFLPEQTMRDATEAVEPVAVELPTVDAEMDQSVPSLAGAGLIESVSDITGLAVVAAHEHRHGASGGVDAKETRRAESAHTTSLARRLQSSLAKMERQLEANAAQSSARKSGDSSSRARGPHRRRRRGGSADARGAGEPADARSRLFEAGELVRGHGRRVPVPPVSALALRLGLGRSRGDDGACAGEAPARRARRVRRPTDTCAVREAVRRVVSVRGAHRDDPRRRGRRSPPRARRARSSR